MKSPCRSLYSHRTSGSVATTSERSGDAAAAALSLVPGLERDDPRENLSARGGHLGGLKEVIGLACDCLEARLARSRASDWPDEGSTREGDPGANVGAGARRAGSRPDAARSRFRSSRVSTGSALTAKRSHGLRAGADEITKITNTTTRVYAHGTGECRQAALDELDELAMLIAGTGPGHE